jgi:RimJ/RimL family protein N-acetyltransferase
MPMLETERLILRPFREDDIDLLASLMSNPDFMRFSSGLRTRDETAALLDKVIGWDQANQPSQFALIIRSTGALVGLCGFLHQLVDDTDEIEIAYRLHPDYWNKGIATEAARAVRDHGFRDWKLPRVISLIHPDNRASQRVVEKIGMKPEKETVFRGFPTIVFSLSREVWSARRDA